MKSILQSMMVLIMALVMVGCAATPPATPAAPTEAATTTDAPTALPATEVPAAEPEATAAETTESTGAAFPVTIDHKFGSTEITEAPERVVVVGLIEQDALLALGVVPVATTEWFGEKPGAIFPWAEAALGGAPAPEVMTGELNFEQIAAYDPDVIIGLYAGMEESDYTLLSQIAPTVAQPAEYVNYGVPWQDVTRTVGQIVGKSAEAEAMITELEARFTEERAAHADFEGKGVALVSTWGEGSFYAYGPEDPRVRFLNNLGFELTPDLIDLSQDGGEFGISVSDERMDLVDTDVAIWFVDDAAGAAALEADPLYSNLAVSTEGRDIFLAPDAVVYDAFNFNTILSLNYTLDELVPMLETAVAGGN